MESLVAPARVFSFFLFLVCGSLPVLDRSVLETVFAASSFRVGIP